MTVACRPTDDDADPPPPEVFDAPDHIWLNVGDIERSCAFCDLGADTGTDAVMWCEESHFPADIRYVRADLVEAVLPTNWREDPDWLALAKAAGIE